VRALGHGHGRKTDAAEAVSRAIAARTTATLQRISPEQPAHALRLLSDRRDDLVAARTQTVNRLHAALTALVPRGAPTALTAGKAAELLRTVRPRERSTTRCTSWPSLKLAATARGAPTTCANAKQGKATTKRCAA
jgi:transposase